MNPVIIQSERHQVLLADTKTANLSTEEESLAEELNKLKIRPDESDQVGTSVAVSSLPHFSSKQRNIMS